MKDKISNHVVLHEPHKLRHSFESSVTFCLIILRQAPTSSEIRNVILFHAITYIRLEYLASCHNARKEIVFGKDGRLSSDHFVLL